MAKKTFDEYRPADSGMIESFLKKIKKDWGPEVAPGDAIKDLDAARQSISTGSTKLDWALVRPLVEGTINEIHGANGCGKTSLSLEIAANATQMGKMVFFFDLERKLVDSQLDMVPRLNRNLFVRLRPSTGEETADKVHQCVTDIPGCVVIFDSLTQMLPEVEDAENSAKQTMGTVAKLAARMVRKIVGAVERNRCMVLFISHITANMDQYDYTEKTKGGNAVPDISAQRIKLSVSTSKDKMIKDEAGNLIGQNTKCRIVKNNQGQAFKEVNVPIIWGRGIDRALDLLEIAMELSVIEQNGAWFNCEVDGVEGSPFKFHGKEKALEEIKNNVAFRKAVLAKVKAML